MDNGHIEVISSRNYLSMIDNDYAVKTWRTLIRCPNCGITLITDGRAIWCEKCDYIKGDKIDISHGRNKQPYTDEDIKFIVDNYLKMSTNEIAEKLGRDRLSINAKVPHLRRIGYDIPRKPSSGGRGGKR